MNLSIVRQYINWNELIWAILSLTPILVGYILFQDVLLLNVGLVTISLFVPIARVKSGIYTAILQFLLIMLCFTLLFYALSYPFLFVILCALMAFGSIYITCFGVNLRTMANFIFIPSVYLACELRENVGHGFLFPIYFQFIRLMPIALLSIIVLVIIMEICGHYHKSRKFPAEGGGWKAFTKNVLRSNNYGEIKLNWQNEAIAIFFSILIAASLVEYMNIAHGEWMIWSTAAVIAGDLASAKKKTQDRLIGLFMGIPLGFLVAQFLPKTTVIYSLAVLTVMLTLVAFKNYRLAFGSRCVFIAVASYIATATPYIAFERVENVVLGGIIGLVVLSICHQVIGCFGKN